jgi:tRNA/tmRNA/rRNA uracil-C5-methylase (TrmA/RlmC/RlmD family)
MSRQTGPEPVSGTEPEAQPAIDWSNLLLRLRIGPVAHGGHCVARHEGRVVFVRHALPGELVRARVTEDHGGAFCRADAIEVLEAAADRVAAPCPAAGPGGCGGCDFQHVSGEGQLRLKEAVLAEALQRIGGLTGPLSAPPIARLPLTGPGPAAGPVGPSAGGLLGWRTRTTYSVEAGRPGMRAHRSHRLIPLDACPLATPAVGSADALRLAVAAAPPDASAVEIVEPGTVLAHRPAADPAARAAQGRGRPAQRRPVRQVARGRGRRPPDRVEAIAGPAHVRRTVLGRDFEVAASGFWQVHPGAPEAFVTAALELLDPRPGERALDLYAGAGLFTAFLAERVGPAGRVIGLEASGRAVSDAAANLADLPQARVDGGQVSADAVRRLGVELGGAGAAGASGASEAAADIVLLDPPRSGAGPAVLGAVLGLAPRAIAYVACDPAAFARDVRAAGELGWALSAVRAFDAFPMTHHIECVGLLTRAPGVVR